MPNILIRKGDIVTIRLEVLEAQPYDDGQQILAKALPNGFRTSWLIPKETEVTLESQHFNPGDKIYLGTALQATGTIQAVAKDNQDGKWHLWVKPDGKDQTPVTVPLTKDTRRVG